VITDHQLEADWQIVKGGDSRLCRANCSYGMGNGGSIQSVEGSFVLPSSIVSMLLSRFQLSLNAKDAAGGG
jgi:hypothetical protein